MPRDKKAITMRDYVALIHREGNVWGAEIPDLPGCFATGKSREEIEERIRSAAAFHIEGLMRDGDAIPEPTSIAITISVPELQPAV
jgi:predicted RNase H-like HicB family nuclease